MYDDQGGVPAIQEVRFSVTHNRGCAGACSFCAIAFHQGRMISCRSEESVVREVEELTRLPDFKGYIHDVGGPTANFRHPHLQETAEVRDVQGQKLSGAGTLSQPGRRPLGLSAPAAAAAGHSRGQKGLCPLGHPI